MKSNHTSEDVFGYKNFPFSVFKRLYNVYLFLDGWTVPQSIINCRPLHCLCVAYWLFISSCNVLLIQFY